MSDYEIYLEQMARTLREHAQDTGHCQKFRDQCARRAPELEAELTELRSVS
jgi:hypothetical protein